MKGLQQTSSSKLPIVFDNPYSTGDSPKFSKKVWDGKIIVARLDGSTSPIQVGGTDKNSGQIIEKIDGDRMNIFAPEALEEGILCTANLKRVGSQN